ncbi:MAG: MFS transporter [Acidobacteria bacterium]|nr:MFS transporter [Acidobacteriota bacterium]
MVNRPARLSNRQIWLVFAGLLVGNFLSALDTMVLITALPSIVGDLGGLNHISWVVTAYLLSSTTSAPIYGKLSDLYGRKRLYQLAIAIFVVGSIASGLSRDIVELIAARAVQGMGAGGLMVLSMSIIGDIVSPRQRGRYQGVMGSSMAVASLLGPIVGGFCVDHLSWRWAFFINVPLGVIALAVTGTVLKLPARAIIRRRFDIAGTLCLMGSATAVLLAVTWGGDEYAWDSPVILGLALGALALVALLIRIERRAIEPVLPLRLFRSDIFDVTVASAFILSVGMWAGWVAMPVFLQVVVGVSASNSGLLTFPLLGTVTLSSIITGRLITRTGRYKIFPVAGSVVATFAFFLYSRLDADSSRFTASAFMIVLGLGLGMWMQTLVTIAQNAVDYRDLGIATATLNFFRSLGGSIGATLALALLNSRIGGEVASRLSPTELGALNPAVLRGDPKHVDALPPDIHEKVAHAFAAALHMSFLSALPWGLAGVAVILFLREIPLEDDMPVASELTDDVESTPPEHLSPIP